MTWNKVFGAVVFLLTLLPFSCPDAVAAPQGKSKSPSGGSNKATVETIARDPYIGAIVIDAKDGAVLFSDNADTTGYPASVVKLMHLLVLQERIAQGSLRLDEQVTATADAARIGGTQVWLKEGEMFSVEELIYAMMVESANDAATALAIHVAGSKQGYVELMNRKAKELGMTSTTFASVHGLPPSKGQAHDLTSPRDLAILSRTLLQYPDTLNYTSTRERPFREGTFTLRSHNHLLGSFPGADGLKTGFIRAGGYNIAVTAQRGGARVIAVVMGSATRKERDRHAADLLAKGLLKIVPQQPPQGAPGKIPPPSVKPKTAEVAPEPSSIPGDSGNVAPAEEARKAAAPAPKAEKTFDWRMLLLLGVGLLAGLLLGLVVAMGRGMIHRR